MLKKGIYTVRDTITEEYIGGILLYAHETAAVRFFTDVVTTEGTAPNRHPEDHELLYIGGMDETGRIEGCEPQLIVIAATLLNAIATAKARNNANA